MSVVAFIPLLISLVPLIIFIIILIWIHAIKENTEKQVQQNEQIIGYLREIELKLRNHN